MVTVFYDPDYTAANHAFATTRKAQWIADSVGNRPISGIVLQSPLPLTEVDLGTAHTTDYIEAVRSGEPRSLTQSNGFSWDAGLWRMVLASNGGAVAAARLALIEGCAGSLSSGLHHACRDRGGGFCTFNGLAIAALSALTSGAGEVLILDLDAHCGGGTQDIIANNPHIWHLDISVDSFDHYKPGHRGSLDIVTRAEEYLATIEQRLDQYSKQHFGLCIYNAGMDPHEDCPIGSLPGINEAMLRKREELVFDWCRSRRIPIAFVMAGGYVQPPRMNESRLVDLHRFTLQSACQIFL